MTPLELKEKCDFQDYHDLGMLMLTVPMPKGGLRGYRVRTPFGLAEIASVNEEHGTVAFWIETAKVRKWLEKNLEALP